MKLLWRSAWIETPGYEVTGGGVLISVAAAVPLVRMENASGRLTRRPGRKVATFLLTDGPVRTLRKARTKRDEPRFTGDFRVTVVLGEVIGSGDRAVALASRVPAGAQQLVVHRSLVQPVGEAFSADDLQGLAASLLTERGCAQPPRPAGLPVLRDGAAGRAGHGCWRRPWERADRLRGTAGGSGGGAPAPGQRPAGGGHGSPAEDRHGHGGHAGCRSRRRRLHPDGDHPGAPQGEPVSVRGGQPRTADRRDSRP